MMAKKTILFISDLDSTLIQMETIDRLAAMAGKGEECAAITRQAMEGQLDFTASLQARVGLLRGVEAERAFDFSIPYSPGAQGLIQGLRKYYDLVSVIVSGGFLPLAERVRSELGFDYAFANELEVQGGLFTGKLKSTLIDGEMKRTIMMQIAQEHDIPSGRVVAMGDGANDIPMLQAAGISIAYQAKPKVRQVAKYSIEHLDQVGEICLNIH